jgi:hypothetical protein
MTHVRGLVCRECGRGVPQGPIHVCEYCFGPLEVDYDPWQGQIYWEKWGSVRILNYIFVRKSPDGVPNA